METPLVIRMREQLRQERQAMKPIHITSDSAGYTTISIPNEYYEVLNTLVALGVMDFSDKHPEELAIAKHLVERIKRG